VKTESPTADPNELRPLLLEKINTLDADGLIMMHRVLQQLEIEDLATQLQNDFAGERNLAQRVDRAIAEFRKSHPYK
jgi:hypothetical protein